MPASKLLEGQACIKIRRLGVMMIKKSETKAGGRPSSPMEDELVRIPIQLTKKQVRRLKALAEDRGTAISALVRAAVDSCFGSDGLGLSSSAPGGLKKGIKGFMDGQKRRERRVLTLEELEELLKNR